MAKSLKNPQPIDWDIVYFIFHPLLSWKKVRELPHGDWNKLLRFYTYFIRGYITAYPKEKKTVLRSYLINLIKERFRMTYDYVRKPSNKTELLKRLESIQNKNSSQFAKLEASLFGSFSLQYRMFGTKGEQDMVEKRLTDLHVHLIKAIMYCDELSLLAVPTTISKLGLIARYNMKKKELKDNPKGLNALERAYKKLSHAFYPTKETVKHKK